MDDLLSEKSCCCMMSGPDSLVFDQVAVVPLAPGKSMKVLKKAFKPFLD